MVNSNSNKNSNINSNKNSDDISSNKSNNKKYINSENDTKVLNINQNVCKVSQKSLYHIYCFPYFSFSQKRVFLIFSLLVLRMLVQRSDEFK